MKYQTALVGDSNGNIVLSHSAPIPALEDDRVMVQVQAVALNPVDTKMVGAYHTQGAISGCDFAGVVTAVGSTAAATGHIQVGDRVAGAVSGLNPLRPDVGAFAQYSTTPHWACLKLPPSWGLAEGVSISMTWTTIWNALFRSLGLHFPAPEELKPETEKAIPSASAVLINGASTAAGTAALQLLKLAGYQTIATCSPRNFELVRSFGADHVFDYNSPICANEIRALTRNTLRYALDCIARTDSTRLCLGALARGGGLYTALNPFSEAIAATRKAVRCDWVLGPEMNGEEVRWPEPHGRPANPALKVLAAEWVRMLQILMDRNLIRPHPLEIHDSGLEGVLEGFADLRAKKISGKKLIYLLH